MNPRTLALVVLTWFRIPEGEQLRYVQMGFDSTCERDRYLTIKKGKVVSSKVVDNRGFGATRSTSDLEWVAMAPEPAKDDGKWTDARLLDRDPARKKIQAGEIRERSARAEGSQWFPRRSGDHLRPGIGIFFREIDPATRGRRDDSPSPFQGTRERRRSR